jgi:hypothetical protein
MLIAAVELWASLDAGAYFPSICWCLLPFDLLIAFLPQCPQPVHVFDGCLIAPFTVGIWPTGGWLPIDFRRLQAGGGAQVLGGRDIDASGPNRDGEKVTAGA